jgi:hypothetical protein
MFRIFGDFFAFEVPIFLALILGIVYIIAFFGAVYYGVDLCRKFEDSIIGKPVKIVLALTPILLIFYAPLLKIYPEKFIEINATIGLLEIISLVYFMFWQSLYILAELLFKVTLFFLRVLFYMFILGVGLLLVGFETFDMNYLLIVVVGYRLFEIKDIIIDSFTRVSGNLWFNLRCVFSF